MNSIMLTKGDTFNVVNERFTRVNAEYMVQGVMGKVVKEIIGEPVVNDLIFPTGVGTNNVLFANQLDLGVRLLELNTRVDLMGGKIYSYLKLQENTKLGKFVTEFTLDYKTLPTGSKLLHVLKQADLTGVTVQFTKNNTLILTGDGITGMCNIFNFVQSFKESVRADRVVIVKSMSPSRLM